MVAVLASCTFVAHSLTIEGAHRVSAGTIESKILTSATSWIPLSSKKYFAPRCQRRSSAEIRGRPCGET
jgi:hypothetical protein